jgi:hypothetical protein
MCIGHARNYAVVSPERETRKGFFSSPGPAGREAL